MKFTDILSVENVIVELHSKTASETIDELVRLLVLSRTLNPIHQDALVAAVKKRESSMSTGIGFNIAIPHAHTDWLTEPVAIFARSSHGIEFNSLDGLPVYFVALLLVPTAQRQTHLHTLACIARLLQSKETRDAIRSAGDAQEIFAILQEPGASKPLA